MLFVNDIFLNFVSIQFKNSFFSYCYHINVDDINPTKLIEGEKACTNFCFAILNSHLRDAHSVYTERRNLLSNYCITEESHIFLHFFRLQFTYSDLCFTLDIVFTKNENVSIRQTTTVNIMATLGKSCLKLSF